MVGKLERAPCGTRDAPQAWFEELSWTLGAMSLSQSKLFPGIVRHRRDVTLLAHVDDLLCGGPEEQLEKVRAALQDTYEVQGRLLGHGGDENKSFGMTSGRPNTEGFD